jgi:hypothetical protein
VVAEVNQRQFRCQLSRPGNRDLRTLDELYDKPDPWLHAAPAKHIEHPLASDAAPLESDPVRTPRVRAGSKLTAAAVRKAAEALPNGKLSEVAAKAKVSESTVRRYLPDGDPRRRGAGRKAVGAATN